MNDATSVVLFNAIQRFDLTHINSAIALEFAGNFFYLFILSTALGVAVSFFSLSAPQIPGINRKNFSPGKISFRLDCSVLLLSRSSISEGICVCLSIVKNGIILFVSCFFNLFIYFIFVTSGTLLIVKLHL